MDTVISVVFVLVALFLIGFTGDLGTQFVARFSDDAELFRPFWDKYGSIGGAVYAGLLVLVFGGLFFAVAYGMFCVMGLDTKSIEFILFSAGVGFVLGYVADVITNRNNYIPTLRRWYDGVGVTKAALWSGGLTFGYVGLMIGLVYVFVV